MKDKYKLWRWSWGKSILSRGNCTHSGKGSRNSMTCQKNLKEVEMAGTGSMLGSGLSKSLMVIKLQISRSVQSIILSLPMRDAEIILCYSL